VPRYEALGYTLTSGWELLAYAGLGVVGGLVSVAFVRGVRGGRRGFALTPLPAALKPGRHGAGRRAGDLAAADPRRRPRDHASGRSAASCSLDLLLVLAGAKLVATALTAGSGGAGGLFTPSLFFGALPAVPTAR
jgi:chloride channel protein, CIC family